MLILGFCLYLLQTGHKFLSHSFYHTLSSAALNTVVFSPSLPSLLLFKCSLLVHGTEDRVEFLSSVFTPTEIEEAKLRFAKHLLCPNTGPSGFLHLILSVIV